MKILIAAFVCGALGGLAPTALELAGLAKVSEMPASGYYLAMLIFGIIGGVFAAIHKESSLHKAFFLGVAAPALIVAGGTLADPANPQVGFRLSLFPKVYAQDTVNEVIVTSTNQPMLGDWEDAITSGNVIIFEQKKDSWNNYLEVTPLDVVFTTPEGNVLSTPIDTGSLTTMNLPVPSEWVSSGHKMVLIPDGATGVSLQSGGESMSNTNSSPWSRIYTPVVAISVAGEPLTLTVEENKPFWSGFYEALGMEKKARSQYTYKAEVGLFAASAPDIDEEIE